MQVVLVYIVNRTVSGSVSVFENRWEYEGLHDVHVSTTFR